MTIISDKPEGLKGSNALDDIPDDLLGPHPARVELAGKTLFVMDKPIEMGEYIKVELTIECWDDGRCKVGEEIVHYRKTKMISAKPVSEPYTPAPESTPPPDDDPAMIDRDGSIVDTDELDGIEPDEPEGDELEGYNPEFSHNGTPED